MGYKKTDTQKIDSRQFETMTLTESDEWVQQHKGDLAECLLQAAKCILDGQVVLVRRCL